MVEIRALGAAIQRPRRKLAWVGHDAARMRREGRDVPAIVLELLCCAPTGVAFGLPTALIEQIEAMMLAWITMVD